MSKIWVFNASPIILLSKAEALSLLTELADQLLIPIAVKEEIHQKPNASIENFINNPKVEVVKIEKIDSRVIEWGLGEGESQVISLALQNPTYEAILDDRLARKCAKSLSIRMRGTIGVVILAKNKGVIEEALPVIQRLVKEDVYFTERWLPEVLALVDEKWP